MQNKETLKTAMDRRLSFLDERPSCRAAVLNRIAGEEKPVMRKVPAGLVFAAALVFISIAALAAGQLLSPQATAVQTADRALEERYGVTQEMQTYFSRSQKDLTGGAVEVTYEGAGQLRYVLGTYTVIGQNGAAEAAWSHDGKDVSGGYASEVWGLPQLEQMLEDSRKTGDASAFLPLAETIAARHGAGETNASSEAEEGYFAAREADKTAALDARVLSEGEMAEIGRQFIVSNYGLDEEQTARLELYTDISGTQGNSWYETVDGKPCFIVRYLLYSDQFVAQEGGKAIREHLDKDGYYNVCVNVQTGEIVDYEYNSALGGIG